MKFSLGQLVATRTVIAFAEEHKIDLMALVRRHAHGDYGQLTTEDLRANIEAIETGARILSAYVFPQGKIYVITEADRSSTCAMMAEDY